VGLFLAESVLFTLLAAAIAATLAGLLIPFQPAAWKTAVPYGNSVLRLLAGPAALFSPLQAWPEVSTLPLPLPLPDAFQP